MSISKPKRRYVLRKKIDIDESEVIYLYISEQMSMAKISSIMRVGQMTIHRILKKQGIETRKSGTHVRTVEECLNTSRILKGKKRSEETKAKMRAKALERPVFSKEHRENLSIAHIGIQAGEKHPLYGKPRSPETKQKISLSLFGVFAGEKSPNWRGGVSYEPYTKEFNKQLKELIRIRDNYTCQLCGVPECECLEKLTVHHIDYDKKNSNKLNLIALCRSCNSKVNPDQDCWRNYFSKKLKNEFAIR